MQIWVVFSITTANSPNNNLSPWKPGQSGNPSGSSKLTQPAAQRTMPVMIPVTAAWLLEIRVAPGI